MIPIWFNCFLSWPHGDVTCLNIHTTYDAICLNPSIVNSWQAKWMKVGRYLRMLRMSFTIAVTHRCLLTTHLSNGLWVQKFISSTVRTSLLHPLLCSLGLNTWFLPPGQEMAYTWDSWMIARKELTLRIAIFQVPIACSKPNYSSWEWETCLVWT